MVKKAHPHYNWLLRYNEYKPEEKRFAYFPYEDITGYKNGEVDPKATKARVVYGKSPEECYKKANEKYSE